MKTPIPFGAGSVYLPRRGRRAVGLAVLLLLFGVAADARAGIITTDPNLPPSSGEYRIAPGDHVDFPFGISVTNVRHYGFTNVNRLTAGPDEIETFDSVLSGEADIGSGPQPFTLAGPVEVIVYGKTGNVTGTFNTEMLAMNLIGTVMGTPVMIRESPTLPSLGQTSVADLGGGLYQIDSFFDVFTELSLDGGATWLPSTNGPHHIELQAVPEPAGLTLAGIGLAGLYGYGWRRRKLLLKLA